jgi:hypothetical protein
VARRLLERDQELATLLDAAREAADGTGSVVLLHGEAGIGKTSLVSAIRSQLPADTRMLVGSCDALSTPRTLGPFRDLAPAVGPRLAEAPQAGERDLVMDALLDELHQPPPSALVVEASTGPTRRPSTLCASWYAGSRGSQSYCCSPTATTNSRETTRSLSCSVTPRVPSKCTT